MLRFLLYRLFSTLLVVFGVSVMVFLLIHMVPGDPVDMMLGESARPADREALRHALGLDLSLWVQFSQFMSGLVRGDLGVSIHSNRPVSELLLERAPATIELALAALLISVVIALPMGVLAAVRRNTLWDKGAMAFSLLGVSMPNFWLGPLLILIFSVGLGWFPVSGREYTGSLVLPAITLGTALAAVLSRMVRSSLLEVLGEDFVRTARAKGLPERIVIWKHALLNALLPVITLLGLQLGVLLGGAVITETVFSWPGLGKLTIDAILRRDYPVVQGTILVISVTYVVVNMLTDMVYGIVDPRIRLGNPK
ncbi:MAG TPA: ABC transporter permease [Gammaproteobacteria bacterium]|nr:ABC transporter permease [Gammaproteobacteria bacterium]